VLPVRPFDGARDMAILRAINDAALVVDVAFSRTDVRASAVAFAAIDID